MRTENRRNSTNESSARTSSTIS